MGRRRQSLATKLKLVAKRQQSADNGPVQGSLFDDDELPTDTVITEEDDTPSSAKLRELHIRNTTEIYTDTPNLPSFPELVLPPRWESLELEAKQRNIPLKPLIAPVHEAIVEVERELRRIQETGIGRLYIISGVTGSGKTTFLNSLNLFIDGVIVKSIKIATIDSRETVEQALRSLSRVGSKYTVVVLEGRETPGSFKSDEIDILLATLNQDFRNGVGRKTLFVIPTTSQAVAQSVSERAYDVGGMTSRNKPFHVFTGPPRSKFISIANDTLRALNESRTLAEYGVSDAMAKGIAESVESIGAFLEKCYEEITDRKQIVLNHASETKRKRIHLWMVFCSMENNSRNNYDIIRSLTFGELQHVQVKRVLIGDSHEVRDWEQRPGAFAQAAQWLDLRLTYLPLRTANAIVSAYGDKGLVEYLKTIEVDDKRLLKREALRARARESLASTAIGAFMRGEGFLDRNLSKGAPTEIQQQLFKEIFKALNNNDKILNSLVAQTLREINKQPENTIPTELQLNDNRTLVSDVAIVTPTDIYCLEFKWRSSVLYEAEVIRETVQRVSEFTRELPELTKALEDLGPM
ncbi:MAG: hypothetical protein ABIV47_09840 [Roseiflexaceae bacterium]